MFWQHTPAIRINLLGIHLAGSTALTDLARAIAGSRDPIMCLARRDMRYNVTNVVWRIGLFVLVVGILKVDLGCPALGTSSSYRIDGIHYYYCGLKVCSRHAKV